MSESREPIQGMGQHLALQGLLEQNQSLAYYQQADTLVQWLDALILQAIHQGASDIHFEHYAHAYRIRFRLDGILHPIAAPDINLAPRITARLKALALLDTTEKRLPQEGNFSFQSTDCRLSSCPTSFGEKIVLRLLEKDVNRFTLETLGFEKAQYIKVKQALAKPQGMILVTGPTGSGKTVTLYTALALLNTDTVNIVSLEDPVEIHLAGINQIALQPKLGFSFAKALPALLRQDPDIIMLGEIRDLESANTAIAAAHSGHLVLSSLHTNSAIDTIERLIHMGLPLLHITSCLSLIIAQRLVRKLCEHCKIPDSQAKGFKSLGCNQCSAGFKGRIGLFEVLPMTRSLTQCILAGANAQQLLTAARAEGMVSLAESGQALVALGLTSWDEIRRVVDV